MGRSSIALSRSSGVWRSAPYAFSLDRAAFEDRYGENLERFRALRQHWDPEGRFLTAGLAPFFDASDA